ncbi:threonine/serine exporter family protein [Apibacter adventoris]|uniref:threonine/serine ThrE exporter family protein n=1 Tax=Apibacter adventoris TaxID=1679466 RepID=UPI000CF74B46|nr:threonine/serine exporter family protein [Apibacter adventoris]PQL94768.1 threonine/serine exporter [Apibacter adventoris]
MDEPSIKIKYASELLSDVAVTLMMSGANTSRIKKNTQRIADALDFEADLFISLSGAVLSVRDRTTNEMHTIVRAIPHVGVNFEIVSEISILSWKTIQEKYDLQKVYEQLQKIKKIAHYPKPAIWFFVGLAGASLSRILGGSWLEFFVTFIATVLGLIVRQFLTEKHFNIFIVFATASFTAVSTVNICRIITDSDLKSAFAASVLFLIPGVPLINSFIDILEGYISQGISRGIQGSVLIFMIALGLFLSLFIFGYEFFN